MNKDFLMRNEGSYPEGKYNKDFCVFCGKIIKMNKAEPEERTENNYCCGWLEATHFLPKKTIPFFL